MNKSGVNGRKNGCKKGKKKQDFIPKYEMIFNNQKT